MRDLFVDQLMHLLHQTITVYTTGPNPQNKISGVLIGIQKDYITLVLRTGQSYTKGPLPINFKKILPTHSHTVFVPGVIAEIPLEHITHILRYAL